MVSTKLPPPVQRRTALSPYSKFWLMASKSVYWQGAFFMAGIVLVLTTHFGHMSFWNQMGLVVLALPFLQTWRARWKGNFYSLQSLLIFSLISCPDRFEPLRTTQLACTVEFLVALLIFTVCNSRRFRPDPLQTFWGRLERKIESGTPIFPEALPRWILWKWYRLKMGESYYQ